MNWQNLVVGGYIGQAVIATILTLAAAWQVVHGQDVPTWLVAAVSLLLGYYFHAGVLAVTANAQKKR